MRYRLDWKITMSLGKLSGDEQILKFRNSLTQVLGAENFPPEALGDLSDLLDTLRKGVNMLTSIMESRKSFESDPAEKLLQLELLLVDDLRMITRDLRPSLKKMVNSAYSVKSKSKATRLAQER